MRASLTLLCWAVLGIYVLSQPCSAQVPPDSAREAVIAQALSVTPDRLLKLVRGEQLIPHWQPDGSQFWFVADRINGVEYLRVDPDRKTIEPLFDRLQFEAAVRSATKIADYTLEAPLEGFVFHFDKAAASFELLDRHWSYEPAANRLTASARTEAADSPDKRWRVEVRDFNLYLEDRNTGAGWQLTTDGSAEYPYAQRLAYLQDLVRQETNAPRFDPDVRWSPDLRRFVTYRMNLAGARRLSAVQSTPPNGAKPRVFDFPYPMAGDEQVPVAQTVIVNVESRAVVYIESPTHQVLSWPMPEYAWTRDSAIVLQRTFTRGFGAMRLYAIDAASGRSSVLTEDSQHFVDLTAHHWRYVQGCDCAAWLSDADGWNQVFLVDRSGRRSALTSGQWVVSGLAGVDPTGSTFFIIGRGKENGRDPYLRNLYRVERDSRKLELLTPEPVDHDVYVSPDGRFFVDNLSLIDRPTTTLLRSTRDGAVLMKLQEANIDALAQRNLRFPEPFNAVAADGVTSLYGAIYKPSTFDRQQRYRVVEYIYTGPHSITTPKSFAAGLSLDAAYAVAELGFVVVVLDARGTSGRGRAFLEPAYRNLHAVGLDDHIGVIKALGAQRTYMDTSHVGIYGRSAGGYDVVRAMTRRPDFYKVGISASGNHDHRLDKAVWIEQWMGFPLGPQYDANSNISWAPKLEGKLLLAHGELDSNVPLAATMRMASALIAAGKPFEFLIVPNADHILSDSPYFNRRRFEFLLSNLSPPAPLPVSSSHE